MPVTRRARSTSRSTRSAGAVTSASSSRSTSSVCRRPRETRSASSLRGVVARHPAAVDGVVEHLLQALAREHHGVQRG